MEIYRRRIYFRKILLGKKSVRKSVTLSHISQREIRMSHDNDFTPFSQILTASKPSKVRDIPENYKEIELCKFISKLCTSTRTTGQFQTCVLGNKVFLDAFQHSSSVCLTTAAIRDNWWYVILTFLTYGYMQSCVACQKLICTSYYWDATQCAFRLLNFQFVRSAATQYYRALNSL